MAIEIERKFLVLNSNYKKEAFDKKSMKQGYLNSDRKRAVRVRISNHRAFLTVKGDSNDSGLSRFEWEKEIDLSEAEDLLKLCELPILEKTRYYVKQDNHVFEVDEFFGDNEGLQIAEVELNSENENFTKPNWLGKEVTGDHRYYNVSLLKNPFIKWSKGVNGDEMTESAQ